MKKLGDTRWDKKRTTSSRRLNDEERQAVYEYYLAGQKTGMSSDELLAQLSDRYHKSSRQIQRIIAATKRDNDQEEQRASEPSAITGEEAPCRRLVRELARTLSGRIVLPPLSDKQLWKDLPLPFTPGMVQLSIGNAVVDEDGSVRVNFACPGPGTGKPHLEKALYSHLLTSGRKRYSSLAGDDGMISAWADQAGEYLGAAMSLLAFVVKKSESRPVRICWKDLTDISEAKPGLTKWFPITAWNDIVMKGDGHKWIDDGSWYTILEPRTGLHELRCGAFTIAFAESVEALQTFQGWHRQLRSDSEVKEAAVMVKTKRLGVENGATQLKEYLEEFSEIRRIPGHCDLCS